MKNIRIFIRKLSFGGDIFSIFEQGCFRTGFSMESSHQNTHFEDTHWNCLTKMRTYQICFGAKVTKIICNYHLFWGYGT